MAPPHKVFITIRGPQAHPDRTGVLPHQAPAAIFSSRAEANAAKALLQSAAIPAFLEDDTLAGGGFRLLVAASDVAKAGEVREAARHSHE
jgi:hypothetical protein